jgi:hypothetical protein
MGSSSNPERTITVAPAIADNHAAPEPAPTPSASPVGHGRLSIWISGFEDLMAEATASGKTPVRRISLSLPTPAALKVRATTSQARSSPTMATVAAAIRS